VIYLGYGSRAKDLITDSDVKQKTVASAIGIAESKMSNYLNERNEMPAHVVAGIANYFSTTTDYLLGLTDDPKPPMSLSDTERTLVERFRSLSRDQKELLLHTAAFMQKQSQR